MLAGSATGQAGFSVAACECEYCAAETRAVCTERVAVFCTVIGDEALRLVATDGSARANVEVVLSAIGHNVDYIATAYVELLCDVCRYVDTSTAVEDNIGSTGVW